MKVINTLELDVKNDIQFRNILAAIKENAESIGTGNIKCGKCGHKYSFDRWIYSIIKSSLDEYICDECKKDG